jgi:uncharacterized protein YegJ (DUF2314 family)
MQQDGVFALGGVVLFADHEPPPPDDFRHLPGFALAGGADPADHGTWKAVFALHGMVVMLEPKADYEPIPSALFEHDPRLSDSDRALVRAARSALVVQLASPSADPFRARKDALRVLGAVLGQHGVAALEPIAQRIWLREALDDELSHDAPLDIDQMYVLHAVSSGGSVRWLHSHGLSELGAVDFDVLDPHPQHVPDAWGLLRAVALASIEGKLGLGSPPLCITSLPLEVMGVGADDFMRQAAPEHASLRKAQLHTEGRVVLCDPPAKLVPVWLRKPRPARLLQVLTPADTIVFMPGSATRRAAERARGTYARFRAAVADLTGLGLPALVKLGYEEDGGDEGRREHLWFEVNACDDTEVDATLTNDPSNITRMRRGERARHSIERLSDWMIPTPLGPITPHRLDVLRRVQRDRARVERLMAEHRAKSGV